MSEVVDNRDKRRFELNVDGRLAIAEYRIEDGVIVFTHTETPPELAGRGVGGQIARGALALARARGLGIVAHCEFMAGYLKKHPELLT